MTSEAGGGACSEEGPVQAWAEVASSLGGPGERRAPLDLHGGLPPSLPGRGLTDESEILRFLQHGTLVGLLPVPHPILIRKYQANSGTAMWFRTYMWGVIYLRWALRGAGQVPAWWAQLPLRDVSDGAQRRPQPWVPPS